MHRPRLSLKLRLPSAAIRQDWKGADSVDLLRHVLESVITGTWQIQNLDCTISAERPRLSNWKEAIRQRMSELLDIRVSALNVKAKSGELVGPIGRGEAIAADVVVLICRDLSKKSG